MKGVPCALSQGRQARALRKDVESLRAIVLGGEVQAAADRAAAPVGAAEPEMELSEFSYLASECRKKVSSATMKSTIWPNSQPYVGSSRILFATSGE